jgi:cation diffusion facilitator CzcD-associated flavoprotein CzcO
MSLTQPIHTERHIRIICIGAGTSGLLFAYKLQCSFKNFSLVIYEKNPQIAGTWFENRYPGYVLCSSCFSYFTPTHPSVFTAPVLSNPI